MKSPVQLSILCVLLLSTGWAHAGQVEGTREVFKKLLTSVPMPPEWEGIWVTVDSIYSGCNEPSLYDVSSGLYRICAGQDFFSDQTCTGTATATTLELVCGQSECHTVWVYVIRDGDSFYAVKDEELNGECGFQGCTLTRSHGTRTGPLPMDYCANSVLPATWGGVKALFR